MTSSKVYITDYIDKPEIEREVLGDALGTVPGDETEVLLVWHHRIDAAALTPFPKLKAVIRYGVGYDNLDLKELRRRGIYACNNPDYGVDEVSDTAIAMVMQIARGIGRYDYICRNSLDGWQRNTLRAIKRTSANVLGVIGAGRIGGSVLLKAHALGFQTCMYDPYRPAGHEKTLRAHRVETLPELLDASDIISLNLTLTDETRGMVNAGFLSMMKNGASLVNTARGGLLDNLDVLYDPMKNGRLLCAALDVLPEEPPSGGKLLDAWRRREEWLDGRLLINPHTAYFSQEAYDEMRRKAAMNALRVLRGGVPLNIVNGFGKEIGNGEVSGRHN